MAAIWMMAVAGSIAFALGAAELVGVFSLGFLYDGKAILFWALGTAITIRLWFGYFQLRRASLDSGASPDDR